jgi:hypothetical protein
MNPDQYRQKKGWRSPLVVPLEHGAPQVMQDEQSPAAPQLSHPPVTPAIVPDPVPRSATTPAPKLRG